MNEASLTVKSLIRMARKQLSVLAMVKSEALKGRTCGISYSNPCIHCLNGRMYFPASRTVDRPHDSEYTRSSVTLNIDGIDFEFFWLTKLS